MTYCTECGTPHQPDSRFCTGCGRQADAPPPASTATGLAESGLAESGVQPEEAAVMPARMPYAPPTTGAAWPEPPAPGAEYGWAAGPSTRPRMRGRLVAALTALVLLLGAGVAAWVTLSGPFAPSASAPAPPPTRPPADNTADRTSDQSDQSDQSEQPDQPSGVDSAGAPLDPDALLDPDAALNQLSRQISLDRPQVQSELAEAWVPQLSSKRPGTVADGISYGYIDILKDHLALRSTSHRARLVWSGDWSSFREGDFYVTVATMPFRTSAEVNAWCDQQTLDSDHCFAKRLSTVAGPEGSTVNR